MTTLKDEDNLMHNNIKHNNIKNYQIMTVDNYGHKHFMVPIFAKIPSQQPIFNVLQGHDYHGIAKQPFQLLVTGFLTMKQIIQSV